MVFSSLLFVFAFLVPQLIIYHLVDKKHQNIVLLIFSLIFYAWGGPRYVILLLADTFFSWFFALRIQHTRNKARKKLYLIGECICVLGLLFIFKYTVFFATNLHALFGIPKTIPNIVLPIGISFYTFQLLSYVIDVYRGQVKAQPLYWKLLLYSSLFHQCIAGPIVRYETVAKDIDHRRVSGTDLYYGVRRFCVGLAKKAVLANGCASAADALLPAGVEALKGVSTAGLWLGMIFYTLQIYLDFSAYSDMAIGMGRMIGFHYLENFNYPYMANSVQDFWRRWHISLSSFFRDYVYIPLGGSRCETWKIVRNMAVVWFLTGMWHGASWNYILWGLYYLGFLLLERFVFKMEWKPAWKHLYTLFIICIGWTIFRFENLGELVTVLLGMVHIGNASLLGLDASTVFTANIFFMLFAMIACTDIGKILRKIGYVLGKRNTICLHLFAVTEMVTPLFLLILAVLALIGNSYNPFLYFQF